MCNCRLCNMSEEEELKGATLCYMVEKLDLSHDQAEKSYALVDEVASVAASDIGSLREVVANVIAVNIDLLPRDNDQCASLLGYLAEVYSYGKKQYEENHKPKCHHRHPDGTFAIELRTRTRTGEEAYCTLCKKTGTRDELWKEAKEHEPKCNHRHPDGNSAIEYCSTYEMHSWDMYCTICGKHGTLEELEKDEEELAVVVGTGDAQKDIQMLVDKGMTEESAKRVVKKAQYSHYLKP